MKRRILSWVLTAAVALGTMGCQSGAAESSAPGEDKTTAAEAAPEEKAEGAQEKKEDPAQAAENTFPEREITIICPWKAGAGADAICRMFEKLGKQYFGVPVVIVNQEGAGGQAATVEYLEAEPDGYTVLFSSSGLFTTQPFMGEVDYSIDDFRIVTGITSDYNSVAVDASLGVSSVQELADYIKSSGKALKYGHSGTGAVPHIAQAMLYQKAGIEAQDIPYNSASESSAALLGHHVMAIAQGTTEIAKISDSKDVVVIGTFAPERSKNEKLKDIPTMKEQGFDITLAVWRMFLVKKDTPDAVADVLRDGFISIINDPEFVNFAKEQGLEIDTKDENEALETIKRETAEAEPIFKELGIGIYSK